MTGDNQSGQDGGPWDPEADAAPGSHPADGAEGAEFGSDYAAHGNIPEGGEDDEVADAEILDAADVSAAVDEAFADDDPLALALNQRDEYLDSLRRLKAEFENYKKRVAKQQVDQVARAAQSLVSSLLPVLDTLDLATEHIGDAESADGRALAAVAGQLHDVLAKAGLERLDPVGEEFDPNAHEAVGHLPADEDDPDGATGSSDPVVGQVMRAGYRWNGAVVRPAMVMVKG
ncbi:MAG TPA: nucleotide exchange factor GrpE [Acidimicrobiales bacterium]